MKDVINGKAYVLGNDIDTDQIIPAEHLVYNMDNPKECRLYGVYALSGVPVEEAGLPNGNIAFIEKDKDQSRYTIIIAGKNFGCGSSREHAPAALAIAGTQAVVAVSYARIFYRNTVDGGFLIPFESKKDLSAEIRTGDVVTIKRDIHLLKNETSGKSYDLKSLGEVAAIVETGGLFDYAKQKKMLSK